MYHFADFSREIVAGRHGVFDQTAYGNRQQPLANNLKFLKTNDREAFNQITEEMRATNQKFRANDRINRKTPAGNKSTIGGFESRDLSEKALGRVQMNPETKKLIARGAVPNQAKTKVMTTLKRFGRRAAAPLMLGVTGLSYAAPILQSLGGAAQIQEYKDDDN